MTYNGITMYIIIHHAIFFIFKLVTWVNVESTPMDQFLSIRSQKCALVGQTGQDGQVRSGRDGQNGRDEPVWSTYDGRRQQPKSPIQAGNNKIEGKKKKIKIVGPQHVGPKITDKYDPNYGYEPYWVGGDWTLGSYQAWIAKKDPKPDPETIDSTEISDDYCGIACSPMYREYGEICGVDVNSTKFETFKNYCFLLASDCEEKKGMRIAHRGPCSGTLETYGWDRVREQHTLHMKFVEDFYKKYSHPIGSRVSSTVKWTYKQFFDDE